jgi:prepilin-type N-terminal cleavage/methylation domain-containing protein
MSCPLYAAPNARRGFTLVELMVVIIILAILSSLTLGGLSVGRKKGTTEVTQFMVQKLSAAIMDRYEEYEDLAGSSLSLVQIRERMREEMPDSWHDVLGSAGSNLTAANTPAGRAYARYYAAGVAPSPAYASAECLYMIITQSGLFPDVLADIRPELIGDIDGDGKKEFWDGWKRPIAFFRWAPGFSSDPPSVVAGRRDYSVVQIADAVNFHDPIDLRQPEEDPSAFALFPLIYSAGPDESTNDPNSTGPSGYGLITAASGWNAAGLAHPCTFAPGGTGLVGAPDPSNPTAYRDNIFSHDLMGN